tara:strand:- start:1366 stop:1875 length:510 start_codon:yes stop_codon:yes gene_type:complete
MGKYLQAREVVENSFWIVESNGTKVGTLRNKPEGYVFYENTSHTETVLDNLDRFRFEKQKIKKTVNASTNGYPTNVDTVYNEQLQDTVAVYTKTATSTQHFAAGYWGILFPHGWRPSFCPRLKTLQGYPYIGPYTNEADMYLAMKRRIKEDEKAIKFTTACASDSTSSD